VIGLEIDPGARSVGYVDERDARRDGEREQAQVEPCDGPRQPQRRQSEHDPHEDVGQGRIADHVQREAMVGVQPRPDRRPPGDGSGEVAEIGRAAAGRGRREPDRHEQRRDGDDQGEHPQRRPPPDGAHRPPAAGEEVGGQHDRGEHAQPGHDPEVEDRQRRRRGDRNRHELADRAPRGGVGQQDRGHHGERRNRA
jgi:hypothetical protein